MWRPVKLCNVTKGAKILTLTWACKLKSNGTKKTCMTGKGYGQIDGVHYDNASIHATVTNKICDVKEVFLKGNLDQQKE
eukprot:8144967-Ditylum_brightwellii.AAC.1